MQMLVTNCNACEQLYTHKYVSALERRYAAGTGSMAKSVGLWRGAYLIKLILRNS